MTLARAIRMAHDGHADESYLHLIIAIELLFSERRDTSQSVASRTALLAHRQVGQSFEICRKALLKEHYAARSRFVHAGKSVPYALYGPLEDITRAVLLSLLWVAKCAKSNSPDFFEAWIKRLDWIVAGYDAGIVPSEVELTENGIISKNDLPVPWRRAKIMVTIFHQRSTANLALPRYLAIQACPLVRISTTTRNETVPR